MNNLSWRHAGAGRHSGPRLSVWKLDEQGTDSYIVGFLHWSYLTSSWEFERLCVESEADMWGRAQKQNWSQDKIYKEFSQRTLSAQRIESLNVAEIRSFAATLPASAQEIVMPADPNERKAVAPPTLEPVAVTLPEVPMISTRDPEALERIRVLEGRLEALCEELEAVRKSCVQGHKDLQAADHATRVILSSHMRSSVHMYLTGSGGGFSEPRSENEDIR